MVFPLPGRPEEQEMVPSRRGDFKCPLQMVMTADIREIRLVERREQPGDGAVLIPVAVSRVRGSPLREGGSRFLQRPDAQERPLAQGASLPKIFPRHEEYGDAGAKTGSNRGEHSVHRTDPAAKVQLAEHHGVPNAIRPDLSRGGEYSQRNRQIVRGAFLPHTRGRQRDEDPVGREHESAVADGDSHAFLGFPHRSVGQSHDVDARQTAAYVHLHGDELPFHSKGSVAGNDGKHLSSRPLVPGRLSALLHPLRDLAFDKGMAYLVHLIPRVSHDPYPRDGNVLRQSPHL